MDLHKTEFKMKNFFVVLCVTLLVAMVQSEREGVRRFDPRMEISSDFLSKPLDRSALAQLDSICNLEIAKARICGLECEKTFQEIGIDDFCALLKSRCGCPA